MLGGILVLQENKDNITRLQRKYLADKKKNTYIFQRIDLLYSNLVNNKHAM